MRVLIAAAVVPLLLAAAASSRQPPLQKTVWDSVYTATQAARGETAYVKSCARCHRESLGGGDEAPALTGTSFLGNWNGQSLYALHDRIRSSMPTDDPGTLAKPLVTDVLAYMLKVNGFPPGAAELTTDGDTLKTILVQAAKP